MKMPKAIIATGFGKSVGKTKENGDKNNLIQNEKRRKGVGNLLGESATSVKLFLEVD